MDVRLYLAQRISAMIMAPLVFVHLGMMIYAIQGGLSAGEILGRTQGSVFWGLFYGLFVVAASCGGDRARSTDRASPAPRRPQWGAGCTVRYSDNQSLGHTARPARDSRCVIDHCLGKDVWHGVRSV